MRHQNRSYKVSGQDLMVLLYHLHKYAEEHGHMDANRTLEEASRGLTFKTQIVESLLESALYCCNMMDEDGNFWHPFGLTFEQFSGKIIRQKKGTKFNKTYNYVEHEDEDE